MTDDWEEFSDAQRNNMVFEGKHPTTAKLADLTRELIDTEADIEAAEAKLKELKEKAKNLSQRAIPDLFAEMELGAGTILSVNNRHVQVVPQVQVSPKKADRQAVCDWLDETGEGGVVKRRIVLHVPLGEEEAAEEFLAKVTEFEGAFEKDVHPQTLKSLVKAKLASADEEEIPKELLGLYEYFVTKVT